MEQENITANDNRQKMTVWKWCRRYISITLIVVVGFLAYVLFFNEHSVQQNFAYSRVIDSLEVQKKIYTDTFLYYQALNEKLATSPDKIEEILRVEHNMSRLNEDVYIVNK